jgi:hypothetical protein
MNGYKLLHGVTHIKVNVLNALHFCLNHGAVLYVLQ